MKGLPIELAQYDPQLLKYIHLFGEERRKLSVNSSDVYHW